MPTATIAPIVVVARSCAHATAVVFAYCERKPSSDPQAMTLVVRQRVFWIGAN